jgi:hypothetical protein
MQVTMKKGFFLLFILGCALNAHSTTVVWDPGLSAQSAGQETVNLAKWIKTELDTANTAVNTLHQHESELVQLARFGDPAQLRSLPGVSTIAELYQVYGKLSQNVASAEMLLSPQRYQNDMDAILGSYQLPAWNGFKTSSGFPVLPGQGVFQFETGSWNLANNATGQMQSLDQQRQKLQQQRDAALSSLQSAATASDVEKYTAVIQALNASIAEVSQAEQELTHRTALQSQRLRAGQQIYMASQAQRTLANDYQTIDAGLNGLPVGNFRQALFWGTN